MNPVSSGRDAEDRVLINPGELIICGTASDDDVGEGIVPLHAADGLPRFLGGRRRDAAGVNHDYVRIIGLIGLFKAVALKQLFNLLSIVLVDLAAQYIHQIGL